MAKRRRAVRPAPARAIGRSSIPAGQLGRSNRGAPNRTLAIAAGIAGLGLVAIGLVLAAGGSPAPTTTPTSSLSAAASATAVVTEPSSSEAAPGDHPPIDGISCDLLEHSAFHIHSHLIVRLGDAQQLVPADIGIHETCLYWVHTHRESGYIHVEAPADTHATLGTFFDIWGQPLTPFQIAEWQAGPGASVFAFVNGEPYEGDPRAIPLTNLVNVELQIALEPLDPLPFTFPDDFL